MKLQIREESYKVIKPQIKYDNTTKIQTIVLKKVVKNKRFFMG